MPAYQRGQAQLRVNGAFRNRIQASGHLLTVKVIALHRLESTALRAINSPPTRSPYRQEKAPIPGRLSKCYLEQDSSRILDGEVSKQSRRRSYSQEYPATAPPSAVPAEQMFYLRFVHPTTTRPARNSTYSCPSPRRAGARRTQRRSPGPLHPVIPAERPDPAEEVLSEAGNKDDMVHDGRPPRNQPSKATHLISLR